jgi:glutathione synthase/RimK-type ligase-like ATP-grasp enzyme
LTSSPGHSPVPRRIITDNAALRASYHDLQAGDAFIGRVRLASTEEHLLLDLVERGIRLFPAALAQQLSRSKTFQAGLLAEWMMPDTMPIHDLHALLNAVNQFGARHITRVVTKHDRKNAGIGILLWQSIEEVYSAASCGTLALPFVVQPFFPNATDIRVIMLGDYQEAYRRQNPHNFRNNLHCGGTTEPHELTDAQKNFCRRVMGRGKFPYAHIDLMVTEKKQTYLAEINLRGGIKGAEISPAEYRQKIDEIHNQFGLDLNR